MKNKILIFTIAFMLFTSMGCWATPNEGEVQIKTKYGKIESVVRPPGVWVDLAGDEYYTVNLRSQTLSDISVRASSKEPANFTIKAQLVYSLPDNDQTIVGFVKKFGLNEEERNKLFLTQLSAVFQTEYRNVSSNYDAYKLVAEQENIQKAVFEALKPICQQQFFINLEAVQFLGKPDFDLDDIDNAAARVVANQKLKEAAEAALAAQRVEVERKQLEAQTFANPQLLKIKELELQKEIAQAWASHQGTLVFGSGNSPIQLNK